VLRRLRPEPILDRRDREEEEEAEEQLVHTLDGPREGESHEDEDVDQAVTPRGVPQPVTLVQRSATLLREAAADHGNDERGEEEVAQKPRLRLHVPAESEESDDEEELEAHLVCPLDVVFSHDLHVYIDVVLHAEKILPLLDGSLQKVSEEERKIESDGRKVSADDRRQEDEHHPKPVGSPCVMAEN